MQELDLRRREVVRKADKFRGGGGLGQGWHVADPPLPSSLGVQLERDPRVGEVVGGLLFLHTRSDLLLSQRDRLSVLHHKTVTTDTFGEVRGVRGRR